MFHREDPMRGQAAVFAATAAGRFSRCITAEIQRHSKQDIETSVKKIVAEVCVLLHHGYSFFMRR